MVAQDSSLVKSRWVRAIHWIDHHPRVGWYAALVMGVDLILDLLTFVLKH